MQVIELSLREKSEQNEMETLSPFAMKAAQSKGRLKKQAPCAVRTCFQRDVDRITYSKAFRRLKHKTQVFLSPDGDHYQTRLTHTLEVARIARTVARALSLNEDLTEAIALGHDLGHTPFGHAGERALDAVVPGGFAHYQQSLRVVDCLEKNGDGLNLTMEVRDGIVCHTKGDFAKTLEGKIVRYADLIAYLNHDIDDALRANIIYPMEIPLECSNILGFTQGGRIGRIVEDMIKHSAQQNDICQSPQVAQAMAQLKEFMFDHVYTNPAAKGEEGKAQDMIKRMYEYFCTHGDLLPDDFQHIRQQEGVERAACDYIAGMTDSYCVDVYHTLFVPNSWQVK